MSFEKYVSSFAEYFRQSERVIYKEQPFFIKSFDQVNDTMSHLNFSKSHASPMHGSTSFPVKGRKKW